jgi:hypothetical protein
VGYKRIVGTIEDQPNFFTPSLPPRKKVLHRFNWSIGSITGTVSELGCGADFIIRYIMSEIYIKSAPLKLDK